MLKLDFFRIKFPKRFSAYLNSDIFYKVSFFFLLPKPRFLFAIQINWIVQFEVFPYNLGIDTAGAQNLDSGLSDTIGISWESRPPQAVWNTVEVNGVLLVAFESNK